MSRNPNKKLCTALRADGQPCKSYAMPGSSTCRSHRADLPAIRAGAPTGNQNRRTHGFYSPTLTADDLLGMATATGKDLLDEVAFTRVMVRKLYQMVENTEDVEVAVKLANTMFRGLGRIAALLKAHKTLSPDSADTVTGAIAAALDELGQEWDLEL